MSELPQSLSELPALRAGSAYGKWAHDCGAWTKEPPKAKSSCLAYSAEPLLRHAKYCGPGSQPEQFTLKGITSEGFFHDLLENRIDCAFPALEPKGIDLTSHKLCKLEIGLVLPPDHRLADQSEIRFERLRNERWILPPREANPVLYDELISCCHKAGFTPDVIAEMTQRPRVVSQVACGIGIATLVHTMIHLCIGGTTFHRLVRPTPMLDCYLVYRKNSSSPLLKSFISICLELGRDFHSP